MIFPRDIAELRVYANAADLRRRQTASKPAAKPADDSTLADGDAGESAAIADTAA